MTLAAARIISSRQRCAVAPMMVSASRMRMLHCTPVACKTVGEKVSEVADKVNRKVGKGLANAIDKGEKATYATKEKMDNLSSTTEEKTRQAKDSAEHRAKGAANKAQKVKKDVEDKL